MKFHSVVPVAEAKESTDKLPVQRCNKHHGKLLDMYCKDHEEVCCAVCAVIEHSCCKGTEYLPDVIKSFEHNKQEFEETLCRINSLQSRLSEVKISRARRQEIFENQADDITKQLKNIRKMVDKHFDELESQIFTQINKESMTVKAEKESDSEKLEHAELLLKEQKEALERLSETGNAASLFVQTIRGNKSIVEIETLEKLLKSSLVRNMYFLPNRKFNQVLGDITSIGEIVEKVPVCSAQLHKFVKVGVSNEKSLCTISGVCSLEDGTVIISDWQNRRLKRLNKKYDITEYLELSDRPYDICTIDCFNVAVSLQKVKKIQFVSTENSLEMTSGFSVSDACRGIAYSNGLIYVACGGWKIFKEGPGHIEVYTISGVLQRKFEEQVSQPGHISVTSSRLYVADNNYGLIIMETNGRVITSFTYKNMNNPLAVCAGPGSQIFLGGWSSHNVMLVTSDGHLLKTLLTQEDGLKDIHTLFYDKLRSRLFYTMRETDSMVICYLDFKL